MGRALVAYFSASGVTARKAKMLAETVGADLYEIRPKVPYTEADLDWQDKNSRSTVEMNDKSARPELADRQAKIADYDTVFVGFPIWWYVAPRIINTFLEAYSFTGKTVVLFATSGSSDFGETSKALAASAPGAKIVVSRVLNGDVSEADLKEVAAKAGK